MQDLKAKTVRGGFAKLCGQAVIFVFRFGFLMIMARLLDPEDFGLVAMVTVVTGLYGIFASAGLSAAAIQKDRVTDEQISTLFWINILVGTVLGLLCLATAPVLVALYHEPRLYWVTVMMSSGFLFSAAGVQHSAILERQLRYFDLTMIETLSLLISCALGISMAIGGFGYWALVGSTIALPALNTALIWVITAWIPGMARRGAGIYSMLCFGSTVTLNSLVVYIAYNLDKLLLGRFWGADVLGIYGRAYQLINVPTANLNDAFAGVGFSALSRLQDDRVRLKRYFLKGYSVVISLTAPITVFCALFADDVVMVVLGPKWADAAAIFRFLAPTILVFGIINPLGWLMQSSGMQGRSLRIALVIAPLVTAAYLLGLPYGAIGVAFAFSATMTLWLVPHILWCLHGTTIRPLELLLATSWPVLSAIVAAAFAFAIQFFFGQLQTPVYRLLLEGSVMIVGFLCMLLFVMGQKRFYFELLKELKTLPSVG